MRIFYVTILDQEPLRSGIDAIRLIANPSERSKTHITLRGPYSKRVRFPSSDSKLLNSEVTVSGIGCFFERKQNTVFWDVHSELLQKLIQKPDYPTAKPHLTIYDGTERQFAHRLYRLFSERDISFTYRPSKFLPLYSSGGQLNLESLDIWSTIDKVFISKIVGFDFVRSKVMSLNDSEKINCINMILNELLDQKLIFSKSFPSLPHVSPSTKINKSVNKKKVRQLRTAEDKDEFPFQRN